MGQYAQANIDGFGDSYTTPITIDELRKVMAKMTINGRPSRSLGLELNELLDGAEDHEALGRLFAGYVVFLDSRDSTENGSPQFDGLDRFVNFSIDLRSQGSIHGFRVLEIRDGYRGRYAG